MNNENGLFIRNILIIMFLTMIIYIILAIIYAYAISDAYPVATPPVYHTGDVINNVSDALTNVIKIGLDILNGSVHMIGNLLNDFATPYATPVMTAVATTKATPKVEGFQQVQNMPKNLEKKENYANLDDTINRGFSSSSLPEPDNITGPIQTVAPNSTTKWCFIGEFDGKRGCAEIQEYGKCPGAVYDNKETCVSPLNDNTSTFLKSVYSKNVKTAKSKEELL